MPDTARRAAERLHLLPVTEVRVVVSGDLAKRLRAARKGINASGLCEIESIDRIKQAQVEFKYHTYAKRYDDEVQTLLSDLPRGVKLVNPEHEVRDRSRSQGRGGLHAGA